MHKTSLRQSVRECRMQEIKSNPILKFNENQLLIVRKVHGYEDVNKLKQDIQQLKDWIKKQNHFRVKEFDEGYLERLLIFNKGSVEVTKKRLDKFCTCIHLMPDFLQNFDLRNEFRPLINIAQCDIVQVARCEWMLERCFISPEHFINALEEVFKTQDSIISSFSHKNICVLPKPTCDNYRILISQANGENDPKFQLIDFYRYHLVIGHYMLCHDYCHGFEIIADSRKITMAIVAAFNPITISRALKLLTETLGQRMKRIHLLSGSKFFDTVLVILKQALSQKLRQRIIIHSNVKSLHEYIPKEQLPKELGGEERTMKELSDFEELSSDENIANVKFMEKAGTDESLRLPCKFNEEYSGMPGSFKSLCVD